MGVTCNIRWLMDTHTPPWQGRCGHHPGVMEGAGPCKGASAKLGGGRLPAALCAIFGYAEELLRAGFAGKHRGVSAVRALEGAQGQKRGRRSGGNRIYIEVRGENLCLQMRVT